MVPEVIFDERIFSFSKRRRDDRRPCRLCADHWPRVSHVLCRLGVRKWRPIARIGSALVTILRGLPEILVVLFIYFGSSQLLLTLSDGFTLHLGFTQIPVQMEIENFDVSPFLCGVIALSLLYAAYASQTLRGALKAVPSGQWESGQALGLSKTAIFSVW